MKRISVLLIVIMIALLAACGPSEVDPEETPETGPALEEAPEAEEDTMPRATITATAVSDPAAAEEAYPARPTSTPFPASYPEAEMDTSFVIVPAGLQCETPQYNSEKEAADELEAAGIETLSTRTIEMMVTTSCGSPTSTHYVVEIAAADLAAAEALGWEEIAAEELEQY